MKQTKSFRNKLIPIIVLSAALPLIILSIISVIRLEENLQTRYEDFSESNMQKAVQSVDIILDKYEAILYDFCADDEMMQSVNNINAGQGNSAADRNTLHERLSDICNRNKWVEGMTVYTTSGEQVFCDHMTKSPTGQEVLTDEFNVGGGNREGYSYYAESKAVRRGNEDIYLFHIGRSLADPQDMGNVLGTVVVTLDEHILKNAVEVERCHEMYIAQDGVIISAPAAQDIGMPVKQLYGGEYHIQTRIHEGTGWEFIELYSLKSYNDTLREQIAYEVLIVCGMVVILVGLAYLLTGPMIRSIHQVVAAMNQVKAGDLTVRIPEDHAMPQEIKQISQGFNDMVEQLDISIERVKKSAIEQKNAELQALEAQIDPHFLYNTLDTINWKAIEEGQMEISEMVGDLADILRYIVNDAGEETTIRKELSWLQQYVRLQQTKVGREVILRIEVPEEIRDVKIHKLLLQPFVENGIKYGFRDKVGECLLLIQMRIESDNLHIIVEDNGKGMTPEILEKLNNEEADMGAHFGIVNVRRRLKLYYSDKACMWFESEQGIFARVHILIPMCGR